MMSPVMRSTLSRVRYELGGSVIHGSLYYPLRQGMDYGRLHIEDALIESLLTFIKVRLLYHLNDTDYYLI
jgi:hypothetical protein